jgi:DNA repair protein RadD
VTIILRPNQIEAADAVEQAYRDGCNRPLVDSCVGSGKSLIMAELARRAWARGERSIIYAHTRELVEQNAAACRSLGLTCGINAAALGERTWRAPVISASIQSVFKDALSFGHVENLFTDEAHLVPHSEAGMYREMQRGFPNARMPGFSGTTFRLQGGSLVEGEEAPFERVVYTYSILDGIRDEYLVPAFSAPADDIIDATKLRTAQGDFTGASQDAQMIDLIDNHIAQMVHHGATRRAWLVFEASKKAATAMCKRLNEWNIPSGLVLGDTPAAERKATIAAYRAGRLRCLVNVAALTTGFDDQRVDLLVMRRKTKSLGLYIQMVGRLLRTIGGNLSTSILAGKSDGLVLDFAANIDEHGPLDDVIQPSESKSRLVSCEECGKRNGAAAARCWSCDALMTKLCPLCLGGPEHIGIPKAALDCPLCKHNMRTGGAGAEPVAQKLLDRPTGAALISSFGAVAPRAGGWIPVRKVWRGDGVTILDGNGDRWTVPPGLEAHADKARWIRGSDGTVAAVLKRNGSSQSSALQVTADGGSMVVPLPVAENGVVAVRVG